MANVISKRRFMMIFLHTQRFCIDFRFILIIKSSARRIHQKSNLAKQIQLVRSFDSKRPQLRNVKIDYR